MNSTREEFLRIIKFGLVGGMNTVVDYGVFTLLTLLLHMHFAVAQTISYAVALANSYFFNSRWTFKKQGERNTLVFVRFVAVNLVSLGVSIGMIALWLALGVQNELVAKLLAIPFSLAVNFVGNRLFVFK